VRRLLKLVTSAAEWEKKLEVLTVKAVEAEDGGSKDEKLSCPGCDKNWFSLYMPE
jgi:hypothetical protein